MTGNTEMTINLLFLEGDPGDACLIQDHLQDATQEQLIANANPALMEQKSAEQKT